MRLLLRDGVAYRGRSFGAPREAKGEVVFNTGLTGYVETLTDPSYRGQILVLTYPLQGNYGVPSGPFESGCIQVQGLVVHHHSNGFNHHQATQSLGQWLKAEGIPAMEAADTRAITKHMRKHGTLDGELRFDPWDTIPAGELAPSETIDMARVAEMVAVREVVEYPGGNTKILVIDTGIKSSIVRSLLERGATVIRAPFFHPWEAFLPEVHGCVLGNGPGNPRALMQLTKRLRQILNRKLPLFGICLGHQLMALAAGARTFKLPYGHRSQNQPVRNQITQRCYITSQNHGYAVDAGSLSSEWEPWMVNLNDGSNEGLRHRYLPFFSVQFHPEAAAGPKDTSFMFDDFLRMVSETRVAGGE